MMGPTGVTHIGMRTERVMRYRERTSSPTEFISPFSSSRTAEIC